jgi:rare lipoprotein A
MPGCFHNHQGNEMIRTAFIAALCAVVSSCDINAAFAETCVASQYGIGDGYHGRRTASGAIFNTHALTAAHRTRAFGSHVTVTNVATGRSVSVRINDRGPFVRGRCIDLSNAAARAIGMGGTTRVSVE